MINSQNPLEDEAKKGSGEGNEQKKAFFRNITKKLDHVITERNGAGIKAIPFTIEHLASCCSGDDVILALEPLVFV